MSKIEIVEKENAAMYLFLARMKGYAETVKDDILLELFNELEEVYNIKIETK